MTTTFVRNRLRERTISRIEVTSLFDDFDYDILLPFPNTENHSILLYGDNGSGKTTILQLLVHLFSPEPFAGHRTAIGRTRFNSLKVTLTNGTTFTASRKKHETLGAYTITITSPDTTLAKFQWTRQTSRRGTNEEKDYAHLCTTLSTHGVPIHFLPENRRIISSKQPRRPRAPLSVQQHFFNFAQEHDHEIDYEYEYEGSTSFLSAVILDAVESIRATALAGTNRGFESANEIYTHIVNHISDTPSRQQRPPHAILDSLYSRLDMISQRHSEYSRWGLSPEINVNEMGTLLLNAPPESLHLLDSVLTPYLDGVEARLDALEDVHHVVSAFSSLMSSFYARKSVRFHIDEGIVVETSQKRSLPIDSLSSGEQQLMLLMCNAIIARRQYNVFAIDEPELSLNIKWQRKLLHALHTMLRGTTCQLLVATHSIELLSQYPDNIAPLVNANDNETRD